MQFHVIAFEGPDPYARAGGLAARVDGLSRTLATLGIEIHLWFVGDPDAPGYEHSQGVHLHRWCQWISAQHRAGVYDGEEAKRADLVASLPGYLMDEVLGPALRAGEEAVVLAEEWHTAEVVVELDRRLRAAGLRSRVAILWNANNLFGFDRVPWDRLAHAAVVTTVSRIMRFRMEPYGVNALVIGNGLPPEAYTPPSRTAVARLRAQLRHRLALSKVARWDPDKNWIYAIHATHILRDQGLRPLLVARGGAESHESEVRAEARSLGLRWADRSADAQGVRGLLGALHDVDDADVVCLRFPLEPAMTRVLLRASDAVLANSRFEPFGLVGLETMAVGGVACTGLTGEDYAVAGRNALVLQTEDPRELLAVLRRLRTHRDEERRLRRAAQRTARQHSWSEVAQRVLLPRLELLRSMASAELAFR